MKNFAILLFFLVMSLSMLHASEAKHSASAFYNQSCIEYKRGNMFEAFVNNRRAAMYEPLDRDNNYNVALIQKSFTEQNNLEIPLSSIITGWLSWQWIWRVSAGLFLTLMIVWALFPNRCRIVRLILTLLLIGIVLIMGFRASLILNRNDVVVACDRASIHSGPSSQFATLYWVHQGLLAHRVGHRQDWTLIQLSNGDEGWILDSNIQIL